MKTVSQLLIAMALMSVAWGFDPVGPPPVKAVEWTIAFASSTIVPRINFSGGVKLQDGLEFLQMRSSIPEEYGITIDGSALGIEVLNEPIELREENLTVFEALAKIADMIQAKLVIRRGIIALEPATGEVE
jgi:hypothetical protein